MNVLKKLNKESLFGFFYTLGDAVEVFRDIHPIRNANCNGCRVVEGKGKKRGLFLFSFLAKNANIVTLEIDIASMAANPKEYIDNMLDMINESIKEMNKQNKIIVPNVFQTHASNVAKVS